MEPLTPASAGTILARLTDTLDDCRHLLVSRAPAVSRKTTAGGSEETVTDLDLQVEQRLMTRIHELHPDAAILSEETAGDLSALDHDVCYVLDPIDGTDLLLAGDPGFAISIAIVARRRVIAGLLDFPARNQRFTSILGGGADLSGRRVGVLRPSVLSDARICVSATQHALAELRPFWESLEVAAVVPTPGFVAKLATVLLGECHAALSLPVRPRRTAIWDYAAAALLVSEVGGTLTTWDGADLLDALPASFTGGWIAGPPDVSAALRRAASERLTALR